MAFGGEINCPRVKERIITGWVVDVISGVVLNVIENDSVTAVTIISVTN